MNNFEEELTCSVCYNIFEDPRILPCSHTFCRSCLESVINSLDSFLWRLSLVRLKCPSCRNVTELSPAGVNALPINFALKSIIEKYKTEEQHSMATCPDHHRQPLNVFCLKDRKLVCGQCLTVGQHQGHPIDDPESAYIKERETASKFLAALSDKSFTGVTAVIQTLEEQMTHCKSVVQEDKREVLSFFEGISDILEQKKQGLLAALNNVNKEVSEIYAPQIEQMKQIEDEQLDIISLCSSTSEESSPLTFLENIHKIRQRMKALKKQPLIPVQSVDIYPRVGKVLTSEWMDTSLGEIHLKPLPKINLRFENKNSSKSNPGYQIYKCILLTILWVFVILCIWNMDLFFSFENGNWKQHISENMQTLANNMCSNLDNVKAGSRVIRELFC
ncbi:tripartite motif-containing protein 59 [Pelobates fuscus]|uniref:tripartite motif-containing protein 59 n=1 Tax=Pelobates fuscus TaxID=191477 RepID=UPI002FE4C9A2